MSNISNQRYLMREQYSDARNFNARVELHRRFSTNPHSFQRWVFDQIELPATAHVLEIGCGPGYLWAENADRVPKGWQITLIDLSAGMIREARGTLNLIDHLFRSAVGDAQALPFGAASFDAVIANHMLYHVPDRQRAYREIVRVLRPGGRLFAATNGSTHLREIHQLAQRLDARTMAWNGRPTETFLLDHGAAELERSFAHVELRRFPDALVITEAEPLVAFVLSMADTKVVNVAMRQHMIDQVAQEITAHGSIKVTKNAGMFLATTHT